MLKKLKLKVRALMALCLGLGVLSIFGIAAAYNGSAQNVFEAGSQTVIYGSSQEGSMGLLGAAIASDAGHLSQEPKPTAFGATYFSGDIEVDGATYLDGTLTLAGAVTLSSSLTLTGELQAARIVAGGSLGTISTSSASYDLSAAEACDNSLLTVSPLSPTTTLIFPSTTTLFADCLGSNGKYIDVMITSVATSTSLAPGTGGTMTYSNTTSTVAASKTANIRVLRNSATTYLMTVTNQPN